MADPYDRWDTDQKQFWDSLLYHDSRYFNSRAQYLDVQRAFQKGFLEGRHGASFRQEWREKYFDRTGVPKQSSYFWNRFREYMEAHGTPSR